MKKIIFITISCFFCAIAVADILYQKGDFTITTTKAVYKDSVIYDVAIDMEAYKKFDEQCYDNRSYQYTPLSLVGNIFSYKKMLSDGGSNGCGTGSEVSIYVMDLSTNEPVSVLSLVDEKELLIALKQHEFIRQLTFDNPRIDKQVITASDTLSELFSVPGLDDHLGNKFSEYQFSILQFNKDNQMIELALMRPDFIGYNHSDILQIILWIKVKDEVLDLFCLESNFYGGIEQNKQ